MEYILCEAESKVALVRDVNKMMKEGWKPQGGPFKDKMISYRDYEYKEIDGYVQALTKE